jgi:hypothetical protein
MADSDQSALICWAQLPTDSSFQVTRPACDPRVDQQTWRIDFQVLACYFEAATIRPHTSTAPPSAGAQVGMELRAAINAPLPPPLHHLFGVDKRLIAPVD